MLGAGVFVMGRVIGMGDILPRPLFLGALVVAVGLVELGRERLVQSGGNRGLDGSCDRRIGMVILGHDIVRVTGIIVVVIMMIAMIGVGVLAIVRLVIMFMCMVVLVLMTVVIMVRVLG
jgi:hypothetical protein